MGPPRPYVAALPTARNRIVDVGLVVLCLLVVGAIVYRVANPIPKTPTASSGLSNASLRSGPTFTKQFPACASKEGIERTVELSSDVVRWLRKSERVG